MREGAEMSVNMDTSEQNPLFWEYDPAIPNRGKPKRTRLQDGADGDCFPNLSLNRTLDMSAVKEGDFNG